MTKIEQRKQALNNHYKALENLANSCEVPNPDGKKLSLKLLKLEQKASKITTDYCNGEINSDQIEELLNPIETEVNSIFNGNLKGFFINRDPRGYALKIEDTTFRDLYRDQTRLTQDMGGYGILSPDLSIESFRR